MPKPRNPENKGLPERWKLVHGAYYYRVPPGLEYLWDNKQMFRLGKQLHEAYKVWSNRLEGHIKHNNIGQLLDRYVLEITPAKAPKSQSADHFHIKKLRPVFGEMPLAAITPQHVYKYADKRTAKVAARREIAMLSHAFTKAVEWGYINKHPFKGEVRLAGEKPRTRYVEDWEIIECLALPNVRKQGSVRSIQSYIRIKLLTGLRRGDLLRLRVLQISENGIHITTGKTGKSITYEWSEELHAAVASAKAARQVDISPFLFCNKRGQGYLDETTGRANGWDSMWQRFMERLLSETKVTERFTEHDLRAKVGSDAESLERARQLLAHADSKITQKVYRRKPEVIRPTK